MRYIREIRDISRVLPLDTRDLKEGARPEIKKVTFVLIWLYSRHGSGGCFENGKRMVLI